MPIVPDVHPKPWDAHRTARMSRVDGCPTCCTNYESPITVNGTEGGFEAHYECKACGQTWVTAWSEH